MPLAISSVAKADVVDLNKLNYETEIDIIRAMSFGSNREFSVQLGVVFVGSAAISYNLQNPIVLIWYAVTYGLIACDRYLHQHYRWKYTLGELSFLLGCSLAIASFVSLLPIFLWVQEESIFKFGACVYLVGVSINIFLVRTRSWMVLLCYAIPTSLTIIAMGVSHFIGVEDYKVGAAGLILALCVVVYLYEAAHEALDIHKTHAATQAKLAQSMKMEAVGKLTGGVAHDFNNILAVTSGNAEFIALQNPDLEEFTAPIVEAAKRGSDLTRGLLAFSRTQPLRPTSIDPAALVDGIARLIERTLGENVEIVLRAHSTPWLVKADGNQLENAVLNLAVNAKDAMPDGGTLTIEYSNILVETESNTQLLKLARGEYVVISVSDTGTGISEDIRDRIFEPFFTTKNIGEGSGLGLSMVYGFARQSGGYLDFYSDAKVGTTFMLYLPKDDGPPLAEHVPSDKTFPRGCGEVVLVIEDDLLLLKSTHWLLSEIGYQVRCAQDGKEALEILTSDPDVQVVLSDVVLRGEINGYEVYQRAQEKGVSVPFIFMSGYPAVAELEEELSKGNTMLISKPFQLAELARLLHTTIFDNQTSPNKAKRRSDDT